MRAACALILLAPLALAACGGEDLVGFEWDVTLTGTVDLCNDPTIGYQEAFRYRLEFIEGGNFVDLAIGPDNFASGQISGCEINYETVVWGETRDGYDLRWRMEGEALYQQAGGCGTQLPPNVDWKGTEVFTVVQSSNPNIPPGCTYTLDAEGTYVGPADGQ